MVAAAQPSRGRALGLKVLPLIAGAGIALGQAPWSLWWLAMVGWVIVIYLAAQANRPGLTVWLASIVAMAISLHWITEPFLIDAASTGWLAPIALIATATGMALFPALGAGLGAGIAGQGVARPIGIAGGIALGELVRSYIATGFPWALPGHILLETSALTAAAFAGAHGLSIAVLLGAGLIAMARIPGAVAGLAVWAVPFALAATLSPAPVVPPDAPVLRLVQPNAPQHQKWDPDFVAVFWQRGLELTASPGEFDAVVWPETALPMLLGNSQDLRPMIARAGRAVPAVVGAQRYGPQGNPRNTMALLTGPDGDIDLIHDKYHLVPFGEYLPFPGVAAAIGLGPLASQLAGLYTPGDGPITFELPGIGPVMPMICYEAIFPQYLRQVDRPELLLHLTNDAWFGAFAGPRQHLAIARLRAAESGLPLLRAANTGITASIDARGTVLASLPLNEAGVLDAAVPPALPPTLYARTGDWPVLVFLLVLGAGLATTRLRARH